MKGQRFFPWKGCISRILIAGIFTAAVLSICAHETGFRSQDTRHCGKTVAAPAGRFGQPENHRITSRQDRFIGSLGDGAQENPFAASEPIHRRRTAQKGYHSIAGASQPGESQPTSIREKGASQLAVAASLPEWQGQSPRLVAQTGSGASAVKSFIIFHLLDRRPA